MLVEAETNHANRSLIVGLRPLRASIQPSTDSHRFTGFSPRPPGHGPDRSSRAHRNQLLMNSTLRVRGMGPRGRAVHKKTNRDSCGDSGLCPPWESSVRILEIGGNRWTAVPILVEAETNHANRSLMVGLRPLRAFIQPSTDSHRFTGFSPRTPRHRLDCGSSAHRIVGGAAWARTVMLFTRRQPGFTRGQ
jgi:hypothetical protein